MCGLAGIVGHAWSHASLEAMVSVQNHRGPDDTGTYVSPNRVAGLGHNRLSIIDLSPAGHQPMQSQSGDVWIAFNGEVYNYLELRTELAEYQYRTGTDTEVILAAYERWKDRCAEHLLGMFSFVIWDEREQTLFAARDRFGVKPLYYKPLPSGGLALSSEIKALHGIGDPGEPDPVTWATYLTFGIYDHCERTFWKGISALPPGHALRWRESGIHLWQWYDLAKDIGCDTDTRAEALVREEYRSLIEESVRLRFRADVPVGINLSGGLDSSLLLGLVHSVQGPDSDVNAFTFVTGDERYDELPWVRKMLARTSHPHHACLLRSEEVPDLAARVQAYQDEPFGGLPTLAYSKVFQRARQLGVIVLLDGQGLDEQWAGYDYYAQELNGRSPGSLFTATGPVQGSRTSSTRPECLVPDFKEVAERLTIPSPFADPLRNRQHLDARHSKIPRALRFNDRISMMHGTELREPFLDHRLFRLAFRQPSDRKIRQGTHKWLLRKIANDLLPFRIVEAPKRPVQTPQREWLRGPLKEWASQLIEAAVARFGGVWLDGSAVWTEWEEYRTGNSDNSFYVWQWISLGLMS